MSDSSPEQVAAESDQSTETCESEEYIVEAIRDWRHNAREKRKEYHIKWQNYTEEENTWEPESNLNCPEILRQFKENMPDEQKVLFEHTDPDSLSGFQRRAKYIQFVGVDGPHDENDQNRFYCLLLFDDSDLAEEITLEEFFQYKPEEALEFCESRLLKRKRLKTSHKSVSDG